jgi:hypothetical protein
MRLLGNQTVVPGLVEFAHAEFARKGEDETGLVACAGMLGKLGDTRRSNRSRRSRVMRAPQVPRAALRRSRSRICATARRTTGAARCRPICTSV